VGDLEARDGAAVFRGRREATVCFLGSLGRVDEIRKCWKKFVLRLTQKICGCILIPNTVKL
jgi:hypothetical protein